VGTRVGQEFFSLGPLVIPHYCWYINIVIFIAAYVAARISRSVLIIQKSAEHKTKEYEYYIK
jgi:hypothetical protein